MKTIVFLLMVMSLVISCGTGGSYIKPQKHTIVNTELISKSYDEVWQSIINYFGTQGIDIKTIDKSSGIISSEKMWDNAESLDEFSYYADFGQFNSKVGYSAYFSMIVKFNIVVIEKQNNCQVTVNCFYTGTAYDVYLMNTSWVEKTTLTGISTGNYENELLTFIKS